MPNIPDLPRFYHPMPGGALTVDLDEEESRHAKVLRLSDGDPVHLMDGKGNLFDGVIASGKRKVSVEQVKLLYHEPADEDSRVVLAVAPTKNTTRYEWFIEKAAEIGVHAIIPLISRYSERSHLRKDRLERIALSAAKQSKSLYLCGISDPQSFEQLLTAGENHTWIAHCHASIEKMGFSAFMDRQKGSTLIAIGPEGDFSEEEIRQAMEHGFKGLDLGKKRLRTETAAITAAIAACLLRP